MEQAMKARRNLRGVLYLVEAAIIVICAVTAVQVAKEGGNGVAALWACGPVLIIAFLEMTRVPLAAWSAYLRIPSMLTSFVIMAAIGCLTFEGMSLATERFMDQRVIDVVHAREARDDAQQKADEETANEKVHSKRLAELTAAIERASKTLADLQAHAPVAPPVAASAACGGGRDKHGRQLPHWACQNKQGEAEAQSYDEQVKAHNAAVAKAQAAVTAAEAARDGLAKPEHAKDTAEALREAEKALNRTASDSTMYRVAAVWFGTPVNKLTEAQFQRFKAFAILGVAGATAVATMLISFVSHAKPRDPTQRNKLIRAIRAYYARKRKDVVRIVEKPTVKYVERIVEVPKHIFVDRPTIVEKPVPGPERIVTHFVGVPTDLATGLALDNGQPVASARNLRAVGGSR